MAVKKEESQILTKGLGIRLLVSGAGAILAGIIFTLYMDGFTASLIGLVFFYLTYVIWGALEERFKKKH